MSQVEEKAGQPEKDGYLSLTRHVGQRILLILPGGEEVWVKIGQIGQRRVQLLFKAPADVTIVREEALLKGKAGGSGSPAASKVP